jgi:hypothetical protein
MSETFLDENIESIEIALSIVQFVYKLKACLGSSGIQSLFKSEVEIKGILLESKNITLADADAFIFNHLHSVLCAFWIALAEALGRAFGNKNPGENSFIDDFRAVIYMFRCAYSHEISKPTWKVKTQYVKRSYHLLVPSECRVGDIEEFSFDFAALNGQRVKNEEFKLLNGILVLSKIACKLLRDAAKKETPEASNTSSISRN